MAVFRPSIVAEPPSTGKDWSPMAIRVRVKAGKVFREAISRREIR
jgi:hypothetical protein